MGVTLPIYLPEAEVEKYTQRAEDADQSRGGWCRDRLRAGVLLWETEPFDRDALEYAVQTDDSGSRRATNGIDAAAMAERVHRNLSVDEYTTIEELTELLFAQLETEVADALKQLNDAGRIEHHPGKGYQRDT